MIFFYNVQFVYSLKGFGVSIFNRFLLFPYMNFYIFSLVKLK